MPIKSRIRTIPDYPKPGIQFRDITTLLQDPVGMRITIEKLTAPYKGVPLNTKWKISLLQRKSIIRL